MATKVVMIAPMFQKADARWLDDFVEAPGFIFQKIQRARRELSWHQRGPVTEPGEWAEFIGYARRAFAQKPDVLVTVFPQLAFTAALVKRFTFRRTPIIAWAFNLGSTANRLKGRLAGFVLRSVTVFVVHSNEERTRYANWLGLPEDRFQFIPLQRGAPKYGRAEDTDAPFILAMGSAGRDYETLVSATEDFPGKVLIIAKPQLTDGLARRENIEFQSGLTLDECDQLLAKARINIVPVANLDTASGQVTFLRSLGQGVATIATDCPGTRDYLTDGKDALIVPPRDAAAMRTAINALWRDDDRREEIAEAGVETWRERFSDEAVADAFRTLLGRVASPAKAA